MGRPSKYPPPFRAHAIAHVARIRPQHPSTWQAIKTAAAALEISAETLRGWVRQAENATGRDQRVHRQQQAELRRLHQENTRLRQTLLRQRSTDSAATASPTSQARAASRSAPTSARATPRADVPSAPVSATTD